MDGNRLDSLHRLPAPLRVLFSCFLLMIGVGYLMALSYLYMVDVEPHQKMGMGMISGIAMKYHGTSAGTRLAAALRGVMADKIDPDDREKVLRWVESGASAKGYEAVKPVLDKNCVPCHNSRSGQPIVPLTNYQEIQKVTQTDKGPSIAQLARVSHVHLFGLSVLFLLTGAIFSLSETPTWLRVLLVIIPYLAIVADIGAWWATKFDPLFAVVVISGGALMGLALAGQIFISLWDMWLRTAKGP